MKPAPTSTSKQSKNMNSVGTYNYQWAFQLIHYFALQGVSQAVISPGSHFDPIDEYIDLIYRGLIHGVTTAPGREC